MFKVDSQLDRQAVSAISMLAADMVEKANSGHPGMPMGAAAMAHVLWSRFLRHNPADPSWPNRDRFVLSAGHGSALLYALLHLHGYDLSLDELKNFRQWESKTPGHPEYGQTPGVECTTGPLGMGLSMGVGMALAERFLAGQFNRPGHAVVDHHVYAIVSDGDLMEGVASEAASLAGTLGLGKLVYLYDDNHISIEGGTDLAFTEDAMARFAAYGWHVQRVADGADLEAIAQAIQAAKDETGRPSIIAVRTHIGLGSPKQDQASAHGEPLGPEAMAATRQKLGWPAEPFAVSDQARAYLGQSKAAGQALQAQWQEAFRAFAQAQPDLAAQFEAQIAGRLPLGFGGEVPTLGPADGKMATRAASGKVLNALAKRVPNLVGGSADLAPSTKTIIAGSGDMRPGQPPAGRNIHFGVREHGMAAIVNGMALHGGVIPYGATFFVFSDFCRPALRLAALQGCKSIFVFTHDSIGVGEDGPTHQPVEHLMSLRVMPGLRLIRPADYGETVGAWACALQGEGPTVIVLTRQGLPILDPALGAAEGVARGAYVVGNCDDEPRLILIGTGSELHLCLAAQKELAQRGVAARVVSMPSWDIFAAQDKAYRDHVLPPTARARLAVEMGATLGWERWVGDGGAVIGLDRFGASAPGGVLQAKFGFTVENVVAKALELLN